MSLEQRTQRLEEQAGTGEEPVEIVINFYCPVEDGGAKVEARSMAPPEILEGPRVRYYFEPEGGGEEEHRELTKEEYDALPAAKRTRPDDDPSNANPDATL